MIDARPQQHGGMLIMLLVLMDAGGYWGTMGSSDRPRWLRSILATNRHHARWGNGMAEAELGGLFVFEFWGRLPNLQGEERNIIIVINVGFTQYAIA